ncbi:MAG: hypothetical protein H7Y38_01645 [Armatimonadetes bacterium]|nr:hypothetical protein [Armatimonadota bacterium]
MSNKINLGLVSALGIALLGFGTTAAHADIVPGVGSPTVAASGTGTFLFTYEIFVTNTQQVNTGDFFVIYDFAGFVAVDSAPGAYSFTNQLLGPNPVLSSQGGVIATDSATLQNVTFTYTGGATIFGGPTSLGFFTIESIFGTASTTTAFVGAGTDQETGLQNANITNVLTPTASAIPEPGEWAFAGFAGMSVLGLVVRARKNKMSGVKTTGVATA